MVTERLRLLFLIDKGNYNHAPLSPSPLVELPFALVHFDWLNFIVDRILFDLCFN